MPVGRLGYGVGNVRCVMCVPFTFTFVLPRLLPGLFMELVEEACDIVVGLWHAWQHGHGHGHLQGGGRLAVVGRAAGSWNEERRRESLSPSESVAPSMREGEGFVVKQLPLR